MKHLLALLLIGLLAIPLKAQFFWDVVHSVRMSATVTEAPASITVDWVRDDEAETYKLYRRLYAPGEQWGDPLGEYTSETTQYIDTEVEAGRLYEYKILESNSNDIPGYGYVLSGIRVPARHDFQQLLIITTASTLGELETELSAYEAVLKRDGWQPRRLVVEADAAVSEIKAQIVASYNASAFAAALILGDVPVPHSGELNPDAHNDHRGAWSADVYYADVDGNWTDEVVNNTSSGNPRNHNVPGDENWDQSYLPSDLEFAIGRVDFSDMPVFSEDEYALIKNYLAKATAFRTGERSVRRRGMIVNNNPWDGGLGQNGLRNFSPLLSLDSLVYDQWSATFVEDYEWYYGASGGSYTSNALQGNSEYYANNDFLATFTAWFGSYFGDYDYPNAFMRAVLGSGEVLSAVWAGAPHWHFHTMGMGFPLAEATLASQNNDTLYTAGYFPRSVHVNLLGDPTLDSRNYIGPTDLTISEEQSFLQLNWEEAPSEIDQYYLYRGEAGSQHFSLLDSVGPATTEWRDYCPESEQEYRYLVRASRLENTPSGTYYNLSAGAADDIFVTNDFSVVSSFVGNQVGDSLYLLNTSIFADSILWLLPGGITSNANELGIQLTGSSNAVSLIAFNNCGADSSLQVFPISTLDDPSEGDFEYFPNPVNEYVIVSSDEAFQQLILSDASGRIVGRDRFTSTYLRRFTFNDLPAGLYFLTMIGEGRRISRRLVVR